MNVIDTPLARLVVDRVTAAYRQAADPADAAAMRAYMRDGFAFLGIRSPRRRELARTIVAGLPAPTGDDLRAVAMACWELPEREYQYFAVDWLVKHAKLAEPPFLSTVETLVTTKSWWDTVDAIAANVVGPIVLRHPEALATMDRWIGDDNLWLARTALLHQLRYKDRTDADRLFRYCTQHATHPDFFIRKAIGWALRDYAKTAPDAVRAYVDATPELSGLSRREALKHLSGSP